MIIYNGKYSFSFDSENAISKGRILSCHLTIIDFSKQNINLFYIKPVVIFVKNTTKTPLKMTCIETMGKKIFDDFELDIKKTIWIEYDPDQQDKLHVAKITPKYYDGFETVFSVNWRKISPYEIKWIEPFIPEVRELSK